MRVLGFRLDDVLVWGSRDREREKCDRDEQDMPQKGWTWTGNIRQPLFFPFGLRHEAKKTGGEVRRCGGGEGFGERHGMDSISPARERRSRMGRESERTGRTAVDSHRPQCSRPPWLVPSPDKPTYSVCLIPRSKGVLLFGGRDGGVDGRSFLFGGKGACLRLQNVYAGVGVCTCTSTAPKRRLAK